MVVVEVEGGCQVLIVMFVCWRCRDVGMVDVGGAVGLVPWCGGG